MLTFPNIDPTFASSWTTKCRVLTAEFGDGYAQRAPDGLNNIAIELDLTWEGLSEAKAQRIVDFLEGLQGYQAFWFKVPRTTTRLKWVCDEWIWVPIEGEAATLTAKFKQVFDL